MSTSEVVLDKSLLYERVRETLRERCRQEESETLPSLRQLSSELGVNHFTISRALRDLEEEGIVKILPRRGIFIQSSITAPKNKNVELVTFNAGLKNISLCLLEGIEEVAGDGMVHNTMLSHFSLPSVNSFLRTLEEREVEGVLFNGVSYVEYPYSLEEANFIHGVSQQLPIAIVGSSHQIISADSIYGDTRPAMREYLEACKEKGFERYAFIGISTKRPANRERFACFRDFILENRLEWNQSWLIPASRFSLREQIREMFAKQPPQVVIAYSANHGYTAIIEAQRCGLQPGRDFHLLVFASLQADVDALRTDATVVMIDEVEVGRRAYQLLQEKLADPNGEHEPRIERIPARFTNNLLEK